MVSGFWLADIFWRYETGISLVGVVGCTVSGKPPHCLHIAIPGRDFAFDPPCKLTHQNQVEAAIKREIKRRYPDLFKKRGKK